MDTPKRETVTSDALGRLTGGIAHDFNNLLLAIHLNLESLRDLLPPDGAAGPILDGAAAATEQARMLTSRLLAYGQRQPLFSAPCQSNEVVTDAASIIRGILPDSITIDLSLAPDAWTVLADRHQLEGALVALAENARHAMPEGGRLAISTSNRQIHEASADLAPGNYVAIGLADTGCGMAPDVLQQATEPFFTTRRAHGASGLGLSQVHGFARQSKGTVTLTSEPNLGTVVTLYLPCAQKIERAIAAPAPQVSAAKGNRILLVEDNELVRRSVRRLVESLGYQAVLAENAQDALNVLASGLQIDALFTDIMLPGKLNGLDLARAIRRGRPEMPVLLTSGFAEDVHASEASEFPIILKPYLRADLAARLRDLMESGSES